MMFIRREIGPAAVRLPDGTILTRSDLPPRDTRRWVVQRKAVVVCAVQAGLVTLEQACEMYGLSDEEFGLWQSAFASYGRKGLLVTKIQNYRQP